MLHSLWLKVHDVEPMSAFGLVLYTVMMSFVLSSLSSLGRFMSSSTLGDGARRALATHVVTSIIAVTMMFILIPTVPAFVVFGTYMFIGSIIIAIASGNSEAQEGMLFGFLSGLFDIF